MKKILPDKLTAHAFRASNGELAWRREQLPEVLSTYAIQGNPVEAFEVWLTDKSGGWTGLIPVISENVPAVCVYNVKGKKFLETRETFVARCTKEILEKVNGWDIDGDVKETLRPRIRYNLYVEAEYAKPSAVSNLG